MVSTNADGTMVGSAFPENDPFAVSAPVNGNIHGFSTSSHGSTEQSSTSDCDSDQEVASGRGEVTPKAARTLFDDNFGSSPPRSPTKAQPTGSPNGDLFSFQGHRNSPLDSPDGENSSNVLNALSLLERSFGRVTVTRADQEAVKKGLSEAMSSNTGSPSEHSPAQ